MLSGICRSDWSLMIFSRKVAYASEAGELPPLDVCQRPDKLLTWRFPERHFALHNPAHVFSEGATVPVAPGKAHDREGFGQ